MDAKGSGASPSPLGQPPERSDSGSAPTSARSLVRSRTGAEYKRSHLSQVARDAPGESSAAKASMSASANELEVDPVLQRKERTEAPRVARSLSLFANKYRQSDGGSLDDRNVSEGWEATEELHVDIDDRSGKPSPFAAIGSRTPLLRRVQFDPGSPSRLSAVSPSRHSTFSPRASHRLSAVVQGTLKLRQADALARKLRFAKNTFMIVFTLACAATSAIVMKVDGADGQLIHFCNVPLYIWFAVAAVFFPLLKLSKLIVNASVLLLEMSLRIFENVHYVLMGLSRSLRILVTAVLFQVIVSIIILKSNKKRPEDILNLLSHCTQCAVIFSLIELVKTLSCRILSLRVNSEALFETLQDTFEKESILERLVRKVPTSEWEAGTIKAATVAKTRHIAENAVALYLQDLYALTLPVDKTSTAFTDQMARLAKQFESMSEQQLDEHAAHAAEYFWWTARQDLSEHKVTEDDLVNVLRDRDDAAYAFSLFDLDGDGYVVEGEVHARFQKIYRERRDVATTLQNTEVVIATLESLVGGIMHICGMFAYFAIFGVDVTHLIVSLSSMALTFAFIFGNSLRTIYESAVFLFVVRPYKVGDAIWYENKLHRVVGFGLLWTHFHRYDGSRLSVPNEKLMATDIQNVTESKNLQDHVNFEVDAARITPAAVQDLAACVQELVHEVNIQHLFDQNFVPYSAMMEISNPLKVQVCIVYQLAFNGEKHVRVCEARTYVTYCISLWQSTWQLSHTQSQLPVMSIKVPEEDGEPAERTGLTPL